MLLQLASSDMLAGSVSDQAIVKLVTIRPIRIDGNKFVPDIFQSMVFDFICTNNGVATLQALRAKYEHNTSLDKAIRNLRLEKKIVSGKTFGPNGDILHCYRIAKAHKPTT